jgi:hypothetical protein
MSIGSSAGLIASRIFYHGESLMSFKLSFGAFVGFFVLVILAPLIMFTPWGDALDGRALRLPPLFSRKHSSKYADRANSASLRDLFGHVWVLLTWSEDLNPAEMERRGNAFLR